MTKQAKIAASLFVLWGLVHILGGSVILSSLADGPGAGYGNYANSLGDYPPLAGSVLGYLAYSFIWIGVLVAFVGARFNWRNSETGLALNTALVGFTDLGLIIFLVLPGYVTWAEASIGLGLFVGAAVLGGLACVKGNAD